MYILSLHVGGTIIRVSAQRKVGWLQCCEKGKGMPEEREGKGGHVTLL